MIPESKPEKTERGLLPKGEGWYVLNMRDAVWRHVDGRGAVCLVLDDFENEPQAEQFGVNPFVLNPGEPMSMYHWEADQEDLLVVSGEAVLIVEGEERPLRTWDFVHCPPKTKHVIVGAGAGPCLVIRARSVSRPAKSRSATERASTRTRWTGAWRTHRSRAASRPRIATAGFPSSSRIRERGNEN